MNNERPYKVTGGKGFLDVRISGAAYQNLVKMAEAMNSVEHCDKDNTAETVADTFFFSQVAWDLADPEEAMEQALGIVDGIDTEAEDEEEDRRRKAALMAAFEKVKFSGPSCDTVKAGEG